MTEIYKTPLPGGYVIWTSGQKDDRYIPVPVIKTKEEQKPDKAFPVNKAAVKK